MGILMVRREEMIESLSHAKFVYVGNRSCLDFVNTLVNMGGVLTDLLEGYDDLLGWAIGAGVLEPGAARALSERGSGTAGAASALHDARELRGVLRDVAERLRTGKTIPNRAIEAI